MFHSARDPAILGLVGGLLWLALPMRAQEAAPAGQDVRTMPARQEEATPAPVSVGADGRLTITPGAAPPRLRTVLEEISAHARIPIVVSDLLDNEVVAMSVRGAPLEDGLNRLLARYDVFYLYSGSGAMSPGALAGVWVYRRGEGRTLEPVPPALWASTKELEAQLDDPDPAIRTDTYEALVERHGNRALATVLRGLNDADEGVRLMTISAATREGVEIPTPDLQAVLLSDRSYAVRRLALEALEGRAEAEAVAEHLSRDPDEHIRQEATLMLARLKSREPRAGTPKRP
jgi:hypothetical protein